MNKSAILALLGVCAVRLSADTTYLHEGHVDIGLHYDVDHGLAFYVAAEEEHHHDEHAHAVEALHLEGAEEHHDDHDHGHDHGGELHPEDVILLLGGYAVSSVPDDQRYAFLGASGSQYYLIGQQPMEGVPFAGWSTEALSSVDFTGDIVVELHAVNGPGSVYLYEIDAFGEVSVLWNSADAGEDKLSLPLGVHRHLNLAVTAPGNYELELHAEGTLTAGGEVQAHTHLMLQAGGLEGYFGHFERLAPDWLHAETGGWLYTAAWPWLWSPQQGWIYAWGEGGPNHFYHRASDGIWLWTSPEMFPYYWPFGGPDWASWDALN